jgi:lysophospholipase L1-like esterase
MTPAIRAAAWLIMAGMVACVVVTVGAIVFVTTQQMPTALPPTLTQPAIAALPTVTAVATAPSLPTRVSSPVPTATLRPTRPPTETPIPSDAPEVTAEASSTAVAARYPSCVSVAGDSVAYGDGVFEVPATGYVRAHMGPVSAYIAGRYRTLGGNVGVNNRSAAAVGISAPNQPSYRGTAEYAALLADRCPYTVILPWINDLTGGEANAHAAALGALVADLKAANPGGKIIVVNYYGGQAAKFALDTFAAGFTDDRVAAFNGAIASACQGGALAQATCIDANAIFAGMGSSYLVGSTNRADLEQSLAVPLTDAETGMLDFYFGQNPTGALVGDGVHLSAAGKVALAAALARRMT